MGKIGCGPFGQFLKDGLEQGGVCTDYVVMDPQVHTSIIFVSQTSGTPDFQPRRDSDYKLSPAEIPQAAIAACKHRPHLYLAALPRAQPLGHARCPAAGGRVWQSRLL